MFDFRTSPLIGAYARKTLVDLEAAGYAFAGIERGVITVKHPEIGEFEFTNDSNAVAIAGPRRGIYADALFSTLAQNDDGDFELSLSSDPTAPAATLPLYDRHVTAALEGTDDAEAAEAAADDAAQLDDAAGDADTGEGEDAEAEDAEAEE